jgi:hypothetical protein
MDSYRQQQELEAERMQHNLACLERIEKAGLPDVAKELAAELGLSKEFNHERSL